MSARRCPKCGKSMAQVHQTGGWLCPTAFGGCGYSENPGRVEPRDNAALGGQAPASGVRRRRRATQPVSRDDEEDCLCLEPVARCPVHDPASGVLPDHRAHSGKFTLALPPSANRMFICLDGRKNQALTHEGRTYKKMARDAAVAQGVQRIGDGPVVIHLWPFFKDRRRDLDNILKPLLDTLTGVAYTDDRQVEAIWCRRHLDKENPRVEILVKRDTPG